MTYASHDEALLVLSATSPELRNGAPNHAPMVVEALATLGRGEAAPAWIEGYRPRLAPGPRSDGRLDNDWRAALGDFSRLGEWQNHFRIELDEASWKEVLDRWLPRLISGSMAAGTHGIIRCGHAARALADAVTAPRLNELADALAYCAARYRTISSVPAPDGDLDLETAVRQLPLLPPDLDRRGFPPDIVKHLDGRPDFRRRRAAAGPADRYPRCAWSTGRDWGAALPRQRHASSARAAPCRDWPRRNSAANGLCIPGTSSDRLRLCLAGGRCMGRRIQQRL